MDALEFSYLLNKTAKLLKPYALKLTEDLEEAKDLLQEALLKAYINKDKFEEGTNVKAWLYTIMRNTFITNYHRNSRRNNFIDTTNNLHYINSSHNVINMVYGSFTSEDIGKAMDEVEVEHKKPFLMYHNGFKYREIAEELNIPIGTVKIRIHLARKKLKSLLHNHRYAY